MEFCIIAPTKCLERYARLSPAHLMLAHIEDPDYWAFYDQRQMAGDFLILDNGAYEGKMDVNNLLSKITIMKPNVAVLPDHLLQDWKKTWRDSTKFLDSYFYEVEDVQWLYIPQAEKGDIVGFIDGLFRALDDERISWIGLPRALCYAITNDLYMRVRVAEQIRKRSNKKIHAFGMVKGSVTELIELRKTNIVSSIDSAAPVWRGMCAYGLYDKWDETPLDMNAPYDPDADKTVFTNLHECGVWTPIFSEKK